MFRIFKKFRVIFRERNSLKSISIFATISCNKTFKSSKTRHLCEDMSKICKENILRWYVDNFEAVFLLELFLIFTAILVSFFLKQLVLMYIKSECNNTPSSIYFQASGPRLPDGILRGFDLLGHIQDAHPRYEMKVQPARISLK